MTLSLHRVHYHILAGYKDCTQRYKDVDRSSIYSSFLVYKREKEGFRSSKGGSADVYKELAKYQQSILEIGIRALVSLRAPLWKSPHKHFSF